MRSALQRKMKSGLGSMCSLGLLMALLAPAAWAQPPATASVQAEAEAEAVSCAVRRSLPVNFTDAEAPDLLTIEVSAGPCTAAQASVTVARADGLPVYHYQRPLLEILPQLIYEPQLAELMSSYVERALRRALLHSTRDLPAYEEVAHYYEMTGDFVAVDRQRYEQLRQQNVPILWHKTGEATWVHVVYDPLTLSSQVIMEGRTF